MQLYLLKKVYTWCYRSDSEFLIFLQNLQKETWKQCIEEANEKVNTIKMSLNDKDLQMGKQTYIDYANYHAK